MKLENKRALWIESEVNELLGLLKVDNKIWEINKVVC